MRYPAKPLSNKIFIIASNFSVCYNTRDQIRGNLAKPAIRIAHRPYAPVDQPVERQTPLTPQYSAFFNPS